jgi:hypothetical protein
MFCARTCHPCILWLSALLAETPDTDIFHLDFGQACCLVQVHFALTALYERPTAAIERRRKSMLSQRLRSSIRASGVPSSQFSYKLANRLLSEGWRTPQQISE